MTKQDAQKRFRVLVTRALFELKLAAALAQAEGLAPQVRALVAGARDNLRRCLNQTERAADGAALASAVRDQPPGTDTGE